MGLSIRIMNSRTFSFLVLLSGGICSLCSPALAEDAELRSLAVGLKPESAVHGFGGKLYVTLMGDTRTEGDGDGSIAVIDGENVTTFTSGLDDPKGMVFINNRLITTDFDTVWAINAQGEKTVLAGPSAFPSPPIYLNDVAIESNGESLLIVDMGDRSGMMNPEGKFWPLDSEEARNIASLGRIYRITLDGKVSVAVNHSPEMPNPNGVDVLANGTILITEFFRGNLLAHQEGKWRTISSDHRSGDGIVHDKKGNLYLSEVFTGRVWRVKSKTGEKQLLATLESAADLILDVDQQNLIVPDTKGGKLVFVPTGE